MHSKSWCLQLVVSSTCLHGPLGPVRKELLGFPRKDPITTRQGVKKRNKSDYRLNTHWQY